MPGTPTAQTVAVIGASDDRTRFGNKAVRAYLSRSWTVFPVHPTQQTVEGLPVSRDLASVPEQVQEVALYVPPKVTMKLLPALLASGAERVWFNPGTYDAAVAAEAERLGVPATYGCAILALGRSPMEFA